MATGKLPPPPFPPKRSLSPPAQRAVSGTFKLDDDTPPKPADLLEYSALLSLFDPMKHDERYQFVELARLFVELDEHNRDVAVEALRQLVARPRKP